MAPSMAFRAFFALLSVAASESVSCDETGCADDAKVLLLQSQLHVAPLEPSLEEKAEELKKKIESVKGGKSLSIEELQDLALEVASAKLGASKADVDLALKHLDKNGDGLLDEPELHMFIEPKIVSDSSGDPEIKAFEGNATVLPPDSTSNSTELLQTTGSWVSVTLSSSSSGSVPALKWNIPPAYFSPRVEIANPGDGITEVGCVILSFVLTSSCYRYFYSNGDMCRCLPDNAVYQDYIDWTWYASSSGNYIYYYSR